MELIFMRLSVRESVSMYFWLSSLLGLVFRRQGTFLFYWGVLPVPYTFRLLLFYSLYSSASKSIFFYLTSSSTSAYVKTDGLMTIGFSYFNIAVDSRAITGSC